MSGDSLAGTSVGLKNSLGADTDEDAVSVSLTTDGFIVAGSSSNTDLKPSVGASNDQRDAIHLRFFDNLTIYSTSWRKAHGPGSYDVAVKVIQVSATQFYLFGYTNTLVVGHSNPDFNYWVFGLGSNGDANTADQFSGTLNDDEKLSSFCVAPTQSIEGYFLGGTTRSATGLTDFYTTKLRKPLSFISTDLQFEKPLSIQLGINLPERTSVFASQSGGFFVLGNENNFNKDQNLILTKINFDGSLAWGTPIVFGGEGLDACGAVQELPDGKILLIGTMRTGRPDVGEFKMTLIKTSRDGKLTN